MAGDASGLGAVERRDVITAVSTFELVIRGGP